MPASYAAALRVKSLAVWLAWRLSPALQMSFKKWSDNFSIKLDHSSSFLAHKFNRVVFLHFDKLKPSFLQYLQYLERFRSLIFTKMSNCGKRNSESSHLSSNGLERLSFDVAPEVVQSDAPQLPPVPEGLQVSSVFAAHYAQYTDNRED